eukprot:jgi/Tetstr1/449090/TSEL_036302.t1
MIRNGVSIPFKRGPPAPFNQGVSMEDATHDQLRFMDDELARFVASGAWEEGQCVRHFLGCRVLPYMDDFRFFASRRAQGYVRRDRLTPFWDDCVSADTPTRAGLVERARQDDAWWVAVPNHNNGRSIYMPVETAYMHVDNSGYGWGAIFIETIEARGFWYDCDCELHITCKELKAVRYAMLTFLSELRGRHVLLHEDNMEVVHVLANLTSRSSLPMTEVRKLRFILDSNDISIRARYLKTTASIWADRLSREIDYDD